MKTKLSILIAAIGVLLCQSFLMPHLAIGQGCHLPDQFRPTSQICPPSLVLIAAIESDGIDITGCGVIRETSATDEDDLDIVINATCRVSVGNDGGSGTIVGRDANGAALILTNAHVVGTTKGRVCKVERWDQFGNRYLGSARIYAAGYSKELSVDFALIRAVGDFGKGVTPVPLVGRAPKGRVTNYGSPKFEWPSMQTLKLANTKGQVYSWFPQSISGRSGSSVIDYSDAGPRVVALLTWGGQGKGYGQSSSFVIDAIRGRLPTSFELLPTGVTEVACKLDTIDDITAPPEPRESVRDTSGDLAAMVGTVEQIAKQQADAADANEQLIQLLVDQTDILTTRLDTIIQATGSTGEVVVKNGEMISATSKLAEGNAEIAKSQQGRETFVWRFFLLVGIIWAAAWIGKKLVRFASAFKLQRVESASPVSDHPIKP